MKIEYIKKDNFFKKYRVKSIDLIQLGLFKESDLEDLNKVQNKFYLKGVLKKLFSYTIFSFKHPKFIKSFILNRLLFLINDKKNESVVSIKDSSTVSDCILLASITVSFKPKTILEIGTYLGWGSTSLKKACPSSDVYTINPKIDKDSNNPIDRESVGSFYKKKGFRVHQIWSDSTIFDYSTLPEIDVTYIDGNHEYDYVYKDLENVSKLTKKCVILDDYIPEDEANVKGFVYGPWNKGVVCATNDFLKDNPDIFKKAYWIKGTDFCVLVK